MDQLDKPWQLVGRDPLVSQGALEGIVVNLNNNSGFCLGDKEVAAVIQEETNKQKEARGIQPLTSSSVSATTIRNYKSLIAAQPTVSIANSALVKSHTRFAAENSLRSAMSFIVTTAATHFVLSKEINPDVYKDLDKRDKVSESSKFLFDQVSKVYNNLPIQPVKRAYVLSTDDTTEFIFKGEGSKDSKANFKLVASKCLAASGTRSKHTSGKKEEDNRGLRVKLTHTMAANGVSAPVFVSVRGLTERELSVQECPSGVLILDLAGPCIGGVGVNAGSTTKGCIIFVCNDHDKETDKVRFRAYRDRVLLPFVESQRAET